MSRFYQIPWADDENEILVRFRAQGRVVIQRELNKRGSYRTLNAIKDQLKKLDRQQNGSEQKTPKAVP
ncbi:MAG TPA: hypothetical protein VFM33_12905 [Aquabacterium sp.]|nr:hypothetical protein [Aquabacterium sp.]